MLSRTALLTAVYPAALLLLTLIQVVWPQRGGPIALSQIVAPYLFLAAAVFLPFAFLRGALALRVLLIAVLFVGLLRFGDDVVSFGRPTSAQGETLGALTWNLEAGEVAGAELVGVIASTNASIVALQELTPEHATLLESDARVTARFPHRALYPRSGVLGIGVLSRYPIRTRELRPTPGELLTLDVGGRALTVLNAHPLPGTIRTATSLRIPYDFDATRRDADIQSLRGWIQPALDRREPVLVLGDYNVTDREPAYGSLTRGMHDAHLEVGWGSGASWRPERFKGMPFGLLRIDYLLSAGGLSPISIKTDCTPRGGDHCVLEGTFSFT